VQLGASRAESPVRHVAAPLPVDALIACEGTSIAQQHCHVSRQLHTLGGDAHVLEHLPPTAINDNQRPIGSISARSRAPAVA
jgi:hypothetical protein